MPRRHAWFSAAGLMIAALLAPAAVAQPGRPAPPPGGAADVVGPDDINRVGGWMRALGGGQSDDAAKWLKLLEQLRAAHPELGPEFDRLRQQGQAPSRDQLRKFSEELGKRPELQNDRWWQGTLQQLAGRQPGRAPNPTPGQTPTPPTPERPPTPQAGENRGRTATQQRPIPAPGQSEAPSVPGNPQPPTPQLPRPGDVPRPSGDLPSTPRQPFTPKGLPPSPSFTPDRLPNIDPSTLRPGRADPLANWWQQNVGPLDDSPAIRDILAQLAAGQGGVPSGGGNESLADLLKGTQADQPNGRLPDLPAGVREWHLPDLGLSRWTGWGDAPSAPSGLSAPSLGSAPSFGSPGSIGGGSWLSVVMLGVVAAAGLVLWWLWPKLGRRATGDQTGNRNLGPWPVDPRTVADRDALVRAFEYLSVLRCGDHARMWNHVTIADDLRRAAGDPGDPAGRLATLYAAARYTPAGEVLPPPALAEARTHLCRLAGVTPA